VPRPQKKDPASDGRAQRSVRSREAMVTALFELIGEGIARPTAQQVAERAGVAIRSVFRHFEDMDTLFAEIDTRLRQELAPLIVAEPPAGGTETRARALVARRAALFERVAPYKRAAMSQYSRMRFVQQAHQGLVKTLRADLHRWLPELDAAQGELADAIELVTSFEAWDRLRNDQRLSVERARATMERSVLALTRGLRAK
jgi:AcrR family transcriptional regulator